MKLVKLVAGCVQGKYTNGALFARSFHEAEKGSLLVWTCGHEHRALGPAQRCAGKALKEATA